MLNEDILDNSDDSISHYTATIAVVDDEPDIVDLVSLHLERSGYRVKSFSNGKELFKSLRTSLPDLIILDLMLPDSDGFEICNLVKKDEKTSKIPVIMLTARSHESDKILGLEIGADDYITKPFSPRELVARVKVILRREIKSNPAGNFSFDNTLEIDFGRYIVFVNKIKVELTTTEYKILSLLAKQKGNVFSRESILEHLGSYDKGVTDRTVDVHIRNLRDKLGVAGKYIINIRGIGYKLDIE